MYRIRQFLALAGLTALEATREPVILLLTGAGVALAALAPLLFVFQFGEEGKLARDGGLALHFVFGAIVAVYAASSALSREMRSGTAAAVLSKPVGRPLFFLAKFAGVCVVVVAFSLCAAVSTLLCERVAEKFSLALTDQPMPYLTDWQTGFLLLLAPAAALAVAALSHYFTRRPFGSAAFGLLIVSLLTVFLVSCFFDRAGSPHGFDPQVQWRILPASLLVTLGLVVLSSVALTLSVRLDTVPALAACGVVAFLGLTSDYFLAQRAAHSIGAACLYRLLPNWQHFWMADALDRGGTIAPAYLAGTALYALLCAAGVVCVGIALFGRSEVE